LIYLTTVDQCRASSKNKPTWTNCRQRKTNVHYQQGAVKSRFPSPEFLIVKAVIFESKQALPLCLSIFLARKFGRQGRLQRFIFATIYCPVLPVPVQPFLTTSREKPLLSANVKNNSNPNRITTSHNWHSTRNTLEKDVINKCRSRECWKILLNIDVEGFQQLHTTNDISRHFQTFFDKLQHSALNPNKLQHFPTTTIT